MKTTLVFLIVFITLSVHSFSVCKGPEGSGILSTQPCNSFCRHRCYYKYNQIVIYFDGTDDQLQGPDGLPMSSFVSQYAVAVTGFLEVRKKYYDQYLRPKPVKSGSIFKKKYFLNVEENDETVSQENDETDSQENEAKEIVATNNQEDINTQFAHSQFFGWSFFPKIHSLINTSHLRHKVDSRGLYISIDASISDKRQLDAFEYTCVKGAHLQNPNTIQHVIESYRNFRGKYNPKLMGYFEQDIRILSEFNSNCKNIAGTSFVDRYRDYINQKNSTFNYDRNWYLAGNFMESFTYFDYLGRVLVMYSNYPVCRCSNLYFFSRGLNVPNGWTDDERTNAKNLINQRCTEELFKKYGSSATLIKE